MSDYPNTYACTRCETPPVIDGKLDDAVWANALWTEDFADIRGEVCPAPRFRTRAKMLWDDDCLYVGAEIEEPHVNGTLTEKNCVIFHDNDFEVFIDPDGDNHNYYEFEMNALNTIWELTLPKPYRAGGSAIHGTNLDGLKSAVHVNGTLNDPTDTDNGWSLEIAFPWDGLARYAGEMACPPNTGDQWRINFSRVEWLFDIIHGSYRKIPREMRAEDNWVWSPQGVVDMHRPWHWGVVEFFTGAAEPVNLSPKIEAQQRLMEVYERQHERQVQGLAAVTDPTALALSFTDESLGIFTDEDGLWYARLSTVGPDGEEEIYRVNHDQHFARVSPQRK